MEQSNNIVGGNLAGRDINITASFSGSTQAFMCRLRDKFEHERENNIEFRKVIDALQLFQETIDDEPIGLETKLELGDRHQDIKEALLHKELFAKCMTRYSLSEAAQVVMAFCLGKVKEYFKARVTPLINQGASHEVVNTAVLDHVIEPVMSQLDLNFLGLTPQEIRGMVYFLTANCFLEWHSKASHANLSPSA